jgi:hypothetical protein
MMKNTKHEVPQHANFLPLLRPNIRRGAFLLRSYNFYVISRFAGTLRFIEAANEEGSVGVNI